MARTNDDVERSSSSSRTCCRSCRTTRTSPARTRRPPARWAAITPTSRPLDLKGILQIPNVGKSIGEKIVESLETGTFPELEALRAQIPPGVRELTSIPGLGPKKAMVVYQELGIASVPELVAAIEDERVAGLKGFAERPRRTSSAGCSSSPIRADASW